MPTIHYFWDEIEDNVVREYDESNNTIANYTTEPTRYGSVLSQERSGEKRYFHFDGQGNRTELTDEAGNVTDTQRYTAFGESTTTSGATSTPFGFGGRWGYHTSGNTPALAIRRRDYASTFSRWLSPDPIAPIRPQSQSTYSFVANNPVDNIDPSGLIETRIIPLMNKLSCRCMVRFQFTPKAVNLASITAPPTAQPQMPSYVTGYVVQKISIWRFASNCSKPCPEVFFLDFDELYYPASTPDKVFWEAFGPLAAGGVNFVKDDSITEYMPNRYGYSVTLGEVRFFPVSDLGCLARGTGDLRSDPLWKAGVPEAHGLPSTLSEPQFWSQPLDGPVMRLAKCSWFCCGEGKNWFTRAEAMAFPTGANSYWSTYY